MFFSAFFEKFQKIPVGKVVWVSENGIFGIR